MDFETFASQHATAHITELLGTQSGAALQQIKVVRDALDAAARALSAPAHLDNSIQELVTRLAGAADAEVRRVREDADAALDALRRELHGVQAAHDKTAVSLAKLEGDTATLRTDLRAAQDRAEAAEHDLMITVDAHAEVEASLRRIESDWKQEQQTRARAEAELGKAHTTIQQLLTEVEQLRGRIEQQASENAALSGELARAADVYRQRDELTGRLEATLAHAQRVERDLAQERGSREQLESALGTSQTRIQALQGEIVKAKELRDQRDALAAQVTASSTRIRALETDLATATQIREHRDALAAQLDAGSTRIRGLEGELARALEIREHRDALATQVEAASARLRSLEGELAAAHEIRGQRDALTARLEAASTRIRILETDLAKSNEIREHRDALVAALDEAGMRIRTLEHELAQATDSGDQRDSLAERMDGARLQALEKELAASRDIRDERDRFAIQLEKTTARVHALEKDLAAARAQPGNGTTAPAESSDRSDALRAELDRLTSLFEASARAVDDLAAASSSNELFRELVTRLALHFSRVALFRLKGNRLEGEHQRGVDDSADFTKVIVPTSVDSILTRAVAAGEMQIVRGSDASARAGTPFGGSPSMALALPLVLQGTTLAVVYADDAGMTDTAGQSDTSIGYARLLVGQVIVLLVRHTHELKTLAELSQYATTLLQEAREMHLADVQAGKSPELICSRLKANIDCASQLYAYRAAMEGTAAAALLDQQILAEIQESTPFARDLAAVLAEMANGDLHITAEAS